MKKLKCNDLTGLQTCDFEATGETDEEVIGKMMQHGMEKHKEELGLDNLTKEQQQEMAAKMRQMMIEENN